MSRQAQRKYRRDFRRNPHHSRPFWGTKLDRGQVSNPAPEASLFDKLCELATLEAAWKALRKGRTASARRFTGTADRVSLDLYERHLERNLTRLRSDLRSGRYRPDRIVSFTLLKPGGGHRVLTVLTINDRVAQRAAFSLIEPLFEPHFLPCSFGFRPNRSTQDALLEIEKYYTRGYRWVVDADIEAFFDSIDRDRLVERLTSQIKDRRLLALLKLWLKSTVNLAVAPESGRAGPESGKIVPLNRNTALTRVGTDPNENETLEGKFGLLARHFLETGLDWGLSNLAGSAAPATSGRSYGSYTKSNYTFFEEEDEHEKDLQKSEWSEPQPEEEALGAGDNFSRELLKRVGSDGLLLGLWLARQFVKGQWKPGKLQGVMGGAALGAGLGTLALRKWRERQSARHNQSALEEIIHFIPPVRRGVAQGSVLSPLYSNIYLDEFDREITGRGYKLVRFADDLLIVCQSRKEAEQALGHAEKALGDLGLSFKLAKTGVRRLEKGFKFLGAELDANGHWLVPVSRSGEMRRANLALWARRMRPEWLKRAARTTPGVAQGGRKGKGGSAKLSPLFEALSEEEEIAEPETLEREAQE